MTRLAHGLTTRLDHSESATHVVPEDHAEAVRQTWVTRLLQSSPVATVTDASADSGAIGRAALEMTAACRGMAVCS